MKITLNVSEKLYEAVRKNIETRIEELQFDWDDSSRLPVKENLDSMKEFKLLWSNAKETN